jgi:hypothetical protein
MELKFNDLKQVKLKKGIADKGWNQHLPNQLLPEEIVWVHPDQSGFGNQFMRIVHSDKSSVSVFSKSYFE